LDLSISLQKVFGGIEKREIKPTHKPL